MPLAAFPKCYLDALVVEKTMTVEEWLTIAAELPSVTGVEFYWGFTPHNSPAALKKIREFSASLGLSIPMLCYSPDFTQPDRSLWNEQIEMARHAISTAAALGAGYCRVLSGQDRPGLSRSEGIRLSSEAIQTLIPTAERENVILILENHYKDGYWQYPEFAWKKDVFLELLNSIPVSPNFGVNYDPSNALLAGDDPIELLEAVKERVVSMHASDRKLEGGSLEELRTQALHPQMGYAPFVKHGVIGQGLNDFDRIFTILKSVGFTGWISIEDGDDPKLGMEHLRLSAQFLTEKMTQYGLP